MKKAIVVKTDDGYEALYVNNELVAEGSPIEEGYPRIEIFTQLAEKYGFDLSDLQEIVGDEDFQEEAATYGSFPTTYKF